MAWDSRELQPATLGTSSVAHRQEEFEVFYNLLIPGAFRPKKVTEDNVDSLLTISEYYQVGFLKDRRA